MRLSGISFKSEFDYILDHFRSQTLCVSVLFFFFCFYFVFSYTIYSNCLYLGYCTLYVSSTYLVMVSTTLTGFPVLFSVVIILFLDPICSKMSCASAWRSLGCDAHSEARCSAKGHSISALRVPERVQHTGSLRLLGHTNFELP